MKFTWKNSAQDVFRIAIFLQISLAVWGQTTKITTSSRPIPTEAKTTVQGQTTKFTMPSIITQAKRTTFQVPASARQVSTASMTNVAIQSMAMTVKAQSTPATSSGLNSMKMTSVTNLGEMTDKSTNQSPDPLSTREGPQKTSAPATGPDNTSMIIIIIVLVAAVIVIFIAMVTAMYICCCKRDRTQPKGYSSPESNGKANGVTKDRPPSGHRLSDEMNRYESVNEKALVDKSGPSVDKPSVTNPTYYSNEGLVKEDESNYVNTPKDKRSSLEQSKTNTGNIFDNIDPTADTYEEQIELKPSESPTRGSSSEEKQTLEEPKSTTDEVPDKGRDTLAPPKPGVRRNVSNRGDNLIKLRPKPVPRARPVSRASQDDGGPAKDPARDEARDSLTDPPSPTANPEKQRLFRPPSKGRGPDGSDQAALLANVLRKSNTPRQVEDDNSDAKVEGTTYW